MSGLNKVQLIGNVCHDLEVRYTKSGQAVTSFSLATNERWTKKDGTKEDKTEFHRIVIWGKLAEISGEYLSKGKQIYVEGKNQTREWDDKEGNKKQTTEVVCHVMTMLGQASGSSSPSTGDSSASSGGQQSSSDGEPDFEDDDIPF
jgi:single-strand DNA-binding protein